jgi:hypothetical protein
MKFTTSAPRAMFKRYLNMALGAEVVNLIGPDLLKDTDQVCGIREITVVENHPAVTIVGIAVQMIDPVRVEKGGASLDAVNLIIFRKQKFSEVGSVLACNASD